MRDKEHEPPLCNDLYMCNAIIFLIGAIQCNSMQYDNPVQENVKCNSMQYNTMQRNAIWSDAMQDSGKCNEGQRARACTVQAKQKVLQTEHNVLLLRRTQHTAINTLCSIFLHFHSCICTMMFIQMASWWCAMQMNGTMVSIYVCFFVYCIQIHICICICICTMMFIQMASWWCAMQMNGAEGGGSNTPHYKLPLWMVSAGPVFFCIYTCTCTCICICIFVCVCVMMLCHMSS